MSRGACAGATRLIFENSASALPPSRGKRVTLLHVTDTHAQLETHWEYLPGRKPDLAQMGGFARLKAAPTTIHQALETYLLDQKVIAPHRQGRSRATDLPEVAFSQHQLLASFNP